MAVLAFAWRGRVISLKGPAELEPRTPNPEHLNLNRTPNPEHEPSTKNPEPRTERIVMPLELEDLVKRYDDLERRARE